MTLALVLTLHVLSCVAAPSAPNVVVLLSDDQGWGDMSLHGNTRVKTPNIDRLFRESLQLKNFMVCPVCSPTRAGLLTGRHSLRLGAGPNVGGELDVAETTLGDFFQAQGYRTGVFGKWHNGMEPDTPKFHAAFRKAFKHLPDKPYITGAGANAHGFDRAVVYYGGGPDKWNRKAYSGQLISWFHDLDYRPDEKGYLADLIVKHAVRFIEEQGVEAEKGRPFFCYVPFDQVHAPFQAKPELLKGIPDHVTKPVHRKHSAMLLSLDDGVGKILKALDDSGQRDNTIVWYFSDNGGLPVGSSLPFRGGKHSVLEGGIHVPAAIRWPAGGFNGGAYEGMLGHLDVLPTLAGFLGKELKAARPLDGVDCSKALRTNAASPVRDNYWAWRGSEVLRTDRWKLFRRIDNVELFDMETDQVEANNVAGEHPEVVRDLTTRLERWRNELGVASPLAPPKRNPQPDPEGDVLEISVSQTGPVAVEDALGVQFAFRRLAVDIGDEVEFDILIPKGDFKRKGVFISPYRNGDPPMFQPGVGIDQYGRIQATGGVVETRMRQRERSAAVSKTSRSSAATRRRPGQAVRVSDSEGAVADAEDGTQPRSARSHPHPTSGAGPVVEAGKWERRVIGIGHEAPLLRSYHGAWFHGETPGSFKVYIDNLQIRRSNGKVLPVWTSKEHTYTAQRELPEGFKDLKIGVVAAEAIER